MFLSRWSRLGHCLVRVTSSVNKKKTVLPRRYRFSYPIYFFNPAYHAIEKNVFRHQCLRFYPRGFHAIFVFPGFQRSFVKGVEINEETVNFKMQELASAYNKLFKYNEVFFGTLVTSGSKATTAEKFKNMLTFWPKAFGWLNYKVPTRVDGKLNCLEALRTAHNKEYKRYVEEISIARGYYPNFLGNHGFKQLQYYACI